MEDVSFILKWWFILFILGLVFLPFTFYLFKNFVDRGYIFSKTISIVILSYLVFLLGILKILQFNILTLYSIICVFLLVNVVFFVKNLDFSEIKKRIPIFVFEELLFLLGLSVWSFVKAHEPSIHSLEKFMDFGFINSILRSEYFPPQDIWFTQYPINYYYFGHLITAVLTKLSSISSSISYNLMLASIFSLCFSSSFSILTNLTARIKSLKKSSIIASGLLGGLIVTLGGNLHTLYSLFSQYNTENPQPLWQLLFTPVTFPNNYWYPNATRFIPFTIHEFPLYSFVVSDLHGHVLDIPVVLLLIAVLLSIISKPKIRNQKQIQNTNDKNSSPSPFPLPSRERVRVRGIFENLNFRTFGIISNFDIRILLLISFLLAVMYMTNAWDGVIYFLLASFILIYIVLRQIIYSQKIKDQKSPDEILFIGIPNENYHREKIKNTVLNSKIYNFKFRFCAMRFALCASVILAGFFLFSLPFNLNFKPFVSGIGVLCAPSFLTNIGKLGPFLFEANHCQKSPIWQLLILYGFFYFWVTIFILFIYKKIVQSSKFKIQNYNPKLKIFNFKLQLLTLHFELLTRSDLFVLILIFLSTILIIIPELIYMKDIYPAHYRANTMFKLVYQAFIMLSLSSTYILIRVITFIKQGFNWKFEIGNLKLVLFILFGSIGLFLVMVYPYFAINSYFGNLKNYQGLDGIQYLKNSHPFDYQAILWINNNIKDQPVMLEAQGDSYTDYGRISANTGLPTILGWTVHEWLWRGTYATVSPRIDEVRIIYEEDLKKSLPLLKKYNVSYVYIGELEKQKYLRLNEEKFNTIGKIIYENKDVRIYKLSLRGTK